MRKPSPGEGTELSQAEAASALPPPTAPGRPPASMLSSFMSHRHSVTSVCVAGLEQGKVTYELSLSYRHPIPVPSTAFVPNWPHTELMTCTVVPTVILPDCLR